MSHNYKHHITLATAWLLCFHHKLPESYERNYSFHVTTDVHLCCGGMYCILICLSLCRMLWRITIPVILAGVLFITAETKKSRPQGSIPSPNKPKENLSSERHHRLLQQKPEVLSSSREALVVTERRYLRRDWCKTQPLRQTISEEGCRSRTVVNRFCYGQCNSFYIPRHMGPSSGHGQNRGQGSGSGRKNHNKAQEPFQSCSFCRPHRITQLTVQLDCPDLQPPFRHRKVQRVKQCRCMSVDVGGHGKLWLWNYQTSPKGLTSTYIVHVLYK